MGKSPLSIRTTLLLIISILNLLIALLVGLGVYDSWVNLQSARTLKENSITASLLYKSMKYLSLERGASLSLLYTSPETAETLYADILEDRRSFDLYLDQALTRLNRNPPDDLSHVVKMKEKIYALQELRNQLDAALQQPEKNNNPLLADSVFEALTDVISEIQSLIVTYPGLSEKIDSKASQHRNFRYAIWEITEYAGREYAIIGKLIVENKRLTPEMQEKLMMWRGRIQHGWEVSRRLSLSSGLESSLLSYIDEAETHYFMTFDQIKDFFYNPRIDMADTPYPITIEIWLELASQAVDSFMTLTDTALLETQNYTDILESQAKQEIVIKVILFICALLLSFYCLKIIVQRVIDPVNTMVNALYKETQGKSRQSLTIQEKHDEIGKLAEVLKAFQENARKIEQSNAELERFAYISAHDLKSPLRAIQTLCQWIEEDLGEALKGKSRQYMDTLLGRVKRMEKLLDDTLEYSRIEAKLQSTVYEVVNGKTLIDDILLLTSPPKNFTISVANNFSEINLPRMPLQQVLHNLINNAIKHHDRDDGRIEVGVEESRDHYTFSIRDDGPGIDPKYHQKIFEMFQTLKSRDEREGSGMGLAMVKKILATCGGEIAVESTPNNGAVFRFTWPKIENTPVRQRA